MVFAMQLRSSRERIYQAIAFEVCGLVLVVPFYSMAFGVHSSEGLVVMLSLSVAVMLWAPIHNTVFDVIEQRLTGRVASERPHLLRVVHAISHEITTVFVTCPLLVWVGGHSWVAALMLDLTLSVAWAIYAYVFYFVFDRLRPVPR